MPSLRHPPVREARVEDTMVNAADYRAMAAEHHRLAGMCRAPESREQHFRLEKDFEALADSEERLRGPPARRSIRRSSK
jgi:hypothetical protein